MSTQAEVIALQGYRILADRRSINARPAVSVVIPAWNEEKHLPNCLASVSRSLTGIAPFERILIDNGSTDRTIEIANEFGVELIVSHNRSIGYARNLGANLAQGHLLLFLDADVLLTSDWRSRFASNWNSVDCRDDAITGSTYDVRSDANWIERSWFAPLSSRTKSYINGGHMLMSKSTFQVVGGFDEELVTGEDVELCRRAREKRVEILPDATLRVIHLGYPTTFRQFVLREVWHGRGDVNSGASFLRSPVAVLSLLALITIAVATIVGLTAGPLWIACLGPILLLLLAIAVTLRVFGIRGSFKTKCHQVLLSCGYLLARALSIFAKDRLARGK